MACINWIGFNEAHHLLAWQFKMLSKNIPKLLDSFQTTDSSVKESFVTEQKGPLYKWLIALNVIMPVANGVLLILFNLAEFDGDEIPPTVGVVVGLDLCAMAVFFLLTVSGVLLVRSVFQIRQFYRDMG